METNTPPADKPSSLRQVHWSAWCLLAFGVALLAVDHWAHVLGALPYLVILACPLLHFFMHGRHGRGHHGERSERPYNDTTRHPH